MSGETEYIVIVKSPEDREVILSLWDKDSVEFTEDCSFECCETTVYDVMAQVVKATLKMKKSKQIVAFKIVGKCELDDVCSVFEINYDGKNPLIKADRGEMGFDEEKYADFMAASYEEIPSLLTDRKDWTFRDAIDGIEDSSSDEDFDFDFDSDEEFDFEDYEEDLQDCFGGYLPMSYGEWMQAILG